MRAVIASVPLALPDENDGIAKLCYLHPWFKIIQLVNNVLYYEYIPIQEPQNVAAYYVWLEPRDSVPPKFNTYVGYCIAPNAKVYFLYMDIP